MKWKWIFILIYLLVGLHDVNATHLTGGYMHVTWLNSTSIASNYHIEVSVFRDRQKDGTIDEVFFDKEINVCVFDMDKNFQRNLTIPLVHEKYGDGDMTNCAKTGWAPVDSGSYALDITLANSTKGYKLIWERYDRIDMKNLKTASGSENNGLSLECTIGPSDIKNSNPVLRSIPIKVMCQFDTSIFINALTDVDDDSLSYKFVVTRGGTNQGKDMNNYPVRVNCNNYYVAPMVFKYNSGFSVNKLFGDSGLAEIDAVNGISRYYSRREGIFAVAIEVTEWRKGIKIASSSVEGSVYVKDRSNPPSYLKVEQTSRNFSLYPNPASEFIRLETSINGNYQYLISDLLGKKVMSGNGQRTSEINTSNLKNGLYFIRINQGGDLQNFQVNIMH